MNELLKRSDMPIGWEIVKLGEIVELRVDRINPLSVADSLYVGLEHIQKDTGKLLGCGNSNEVRSTKNSFIRGDVLYGKLRPYLNKVLVAEFDGVCSTDILVFKKNPNLDSKFLFFRLLSPDFVRYANLNVSGVQHPRVSYNILCDFPIEVAPLSEQSRIVNRIEEIFSELDSAVASLQRVQTQLRRYRQSVLKHAVDGKLTAEWREEHKGKIEPADELLKRILAERRAKWEELELAKMKVNGRVPEDQSWKKKYKEPEQPNADGLPELPDGWCWASVDQVGEVQLGRQRAPQHHRGPHMRPYLRVQNVFENRIDISDVMEMNFTPKEYETFCLEPGDILLNEGQSLELVGRPAIYRGELPGACFTNTLVRFRASNFVDREFALMVFRYYLRSGRFRKVARITTNIAHLGTGRFARLEFPLPPLEEQRQLAMIVGAAFDSGESIQTVTVRQLKRCGRLKQAIFSTAFSGGLTQQNPNEEPAAILLERIRAEREKEANAKGKVRESSKAPRIRKTRRKIEQHEGQRELFKKQG